MTVGRGGGTFRRTILILLVVSLVVAVLAVVLMMSGERGDTDPHERGAAGRTDAANATDSSTGTDTAGGTDTTTAPDSSTGTDAATVPDSAGGTDAADDGPPEPLGSPLQGPRAGRMQRWEPRFGNDESTRVVPARSPVVDAVVRAVSLDTADGRDAVAVRIARGRWDELTTGVASEVPPIVWESIARGMEDAGELREVYAIENARHAEYLLRFANDQLLLRLYGGNSSVDDAEVEALPPP